MIGVNLCWLIHSVLFILSFCQGSREGIEGMVQGLPAAWLGVSALESLIEAHCRLIVHLVWDNCTSHSSRSKAMAMNMARQGSHQNTAVLHQSQYFTS